MICLLEGGKRAAFGKMKIPINVAEFYLLIINQYTAILIVDWLSKLVCL